MLHAYISSIFDYLVLPCVFRRCTVVFWSMQACSFWLVYTCVNCGIKYLKTVPNGDMLHIQLTRVYLGSYVNKEVAYINTVCRPRGIPGITWDTLLRNACRCPSFLMLRVKGVKCCAFLLYAFDAYGVFLVFLFADRCRNV